MLQHQPAYGLLTLDGALMHRHGVAYLATGWQRFLVIELMQPLRVLSVQLHTAPFCHSNNRVLMYGIIGRFAEDEAGMMRPQPRAGRPLWHR